MPMGGRYDDYGIITIRPFRGRCRWQPPGCTIDIAQWEALVTLLKNIEAWEQEWHQPFEAVRATWDASSPTPDEDPIPDDETLVDLVHRVRDEIA